MNTPSQPSSETRLRFFHSLRGKLILVFLAISLIPLIIVGVLVDIQVQNALRSEVINKLIAVRDIKSKQITNYFNERSADIKILSKNPTIITAMKTFDEALHVQIADLNRDKVGVMNQYRSLYQAQPDLLDAGDGSAYSAIHAQYHSMFKEYRDAYHYYDIFLVEPLLGTIIYSVAKEDDFGTSLKNGLYANTSFGHIFQEMLAATDRDMTRWKDFIYYEPSKEAAAFIASPIFSHSKLIGVLIFQIPATPIDTIMQEHTGLGETGETILVSSDDFLLRSNSRLVEEKTLFKLKMDNEATRAAAMGETGVKTINYLGKAVIIAYMPLNISSVRWSLNAKINEDEAFATIRQMLIWIFSIMCIGALIVIVVAFFFSNALAKPVQAMTDIARQLANGNLNLTVDTHCGIDDIDAMGDAFQQMITNFQKVTEDVVLMSFGLLVGDLRIKPQAEYQGDFVQIENSLETGFSNLQAVVEDIVQISQELAEGGKNVVARAEYQGDFLQIKDALETAATKLAEATTKNAIQDWLKTGQTQLTEQISGEQDVLTLANHIITFLSTYLEAQVGAFYLLDNANKNACLKLLASYAYTQRKGVANEFQIGEGLIGQAALEKERIVVTEIPKDYVSIQSGLGEAVPQQLLVIPFLYENAVKGVIEIGSFHEITEVQLELLNQVMPHIGIAVNTAESRANMQALLQQK